MVKRKQRVSTASNGSRHCVPACEMEHLFDVLCSYTVKVGFDEAWDLKEYKTAAKAHAVRGPALAGNSACPETLLLLVCLCVLACVCVCVRVCVCVCVCVCVFFCYHQIVS